MGARNLPGITKPPSTSELLHWGRALDLFDSTVRAHIEQFHDAFQSKASSRTHAWASLPASSCLFKLGDDLDLAMKLKV